VEKRAEIPDPGDELWPNIKSEPSPIRESPYDSSGQENALTEKVIHAQRQIQQHSRFVIAQLQSSDPLNFLEAVGDGLLMQTHSLRRRVLGTIGSEVYAQGVEQRFALRRSFAQQPSHLLSDKAPEICAVPHAHQQSGDSDLLDGKHPIAARVTRNGKCNPGVLAGRWNGVWSIDAAAYAYSGDCARHRVVHVLA
jgi:hypothetical protein